MCQEAVGTQQLGPRPLPGTNLTLPCSSNPLDYAPVVEALPDMDSPSLFGLPANVNRAVGRANGIAVITQLRQITASQVNSDCAFKLFSQSCAETYWLHLLQYKTHPDGSVRRLGPRLPDDETRLQRICHTRFSKTDARAQADLAVDGLPRASSHASAAEHC